MGLPGLTKEQMVEVDRIMIEDLHIPVELMMENAGFNLAQLAVRVNPQNNRTFVIISGPGNNGGGGLVAARRLHNWNFNVMINVPKGVDSLRETPRIQLERVKAIGLPIIEGLPSDDATNRNSLFIDAYIGYGFTRRDDEVSDAVFDFLSQQSTVVSLDAPSGLDVTTGENIGRLKPISTLTIAFAKQGLLKTYPEMTGVLYVCDIGVPRSIYESALGLTWKSPFDLASLNRLTNAFATDSLLRIEVFKSPQDDTLYWELH